MKRSLMIILSLFLLTSLSSCTQVFVWTLKDVLALTFIGAIFAAIGYVYLGVKIDEWKKRNRK